LQNSQKNFTWRLSQRTDHNFVPVLLGLSLWRRHK